MFKETVQIKIVGDYQRYFDKAIELGYKNFYMGSKQEYIVLYINKEFNILAYNNGSKIISEKEFFGETMLENLDLRILSVLVNLTCETLDSFSAYDVTTILRSRLPNFNILHNDVKNAVVDYANANILSVTDNGTYLVYNKKAVTTGTSSSVNDLKVQLTVNPSNIKQAIINAGNKFRQAAKEYTETKLDKLLKEKNSNVTLNMSKILPLQSEGRVNITELIKAHFPKDRFVYVKRDKNANKVIISNVAQPNTTQVLIGEEVRIRTGFYGSNNVKVNFLKNAVEVTPY